jgi:multicomponent Na+:H+ antiporter subunit D
LDVIVAISLAVSLLTLFSMTKIWAEAFWKPAPKGAPRPHKPAGFALWAPALSLAAMTLAIAVAAGPVFELSRTAAEQLLNPQYYIQAVLRAQR